jgi:hypothetical protein
MPESNVDSDDYYKVLGLNKDCSDVDIKKAYRRLAMKWHPDKNLDNREGAEEKFKKVNEAYEVLSDKDKRAQYDQFGKMSGGMPGGGGFPGADGMNYARAEDIFAQFFGGRDPFEAFFGGGMGGGGMGGGGGGMPPGFMFQQMGGSGRGAQFGGVPGGMQGMQFGGMPGGMQGMQFGGMPGGIQFGGMPGMMPGGMPGMGARRASGASEVPNTFAPGTIVLLRGLKSAAEWNGTYGQVMAYDASKERYTVHLDEEGQTLALKPDNLQQVVKGVELAEVQSQPQLNGKKGTLFDYDGARHRGHVRLGHGQNASFQMGSIILPPGTVVRIVGLEKSPQHNGKWATIREVSKADGRYTVSLSESELLRPRFANVMP